MNFCNLLQAYSLFNIYVKNCTVYANSVRVNVVGDIKLQRSPLQNSNLIITLSVGIVLTMCNGFQNLDALYRPLAGKPFVLQDFVLGMGTSLASALTAETIFEIMKCISDVDMPARGGMGVKIRNFQVFLFWLRPR